MIEWFNNDIRVVELTLDRSEREVLAALVIHNGDVIIPDVRFLIVARGVALLAGHQRGHMEDHLHHVVLPDVRKFAVVAVLLQAAKEEGLRVCVFQRYQGSQPVQEFHVPARPITIT